MDYMNLFVRFLISAGIALMVGFAIYGITFPLLAEGLTKTELILGQYFLPATITIITFVFIFIITGREGGK